jgi:NRAMP (natural resistance-associated macrophage protein)-like metal ion transporter
MKIKNFVRIGPGLITGAADDDPSGIATYSQAGAQFGYGLLWSALFMLPLQIAIQEACARIGAVTGKGIALVIKEHYGKRMLFFVVSLLLIANTINIGADIGAMAAAANLIIPIHFVVLCFAFTAIILLAIIFISYKAYARILKWLCLFLLSYPITVFIVSEDWWLILKATIIPNFEFNFEFLFMLVAVLGTTISPYLFFWQASEEVEEIQARDLLDKNKKPIINKGYIRNLRIDNFTGMFSSEAAAWAIVVVAATVLHTNGITNIETAADAAKALEPLVQNFPHAGFIAKVIFATGIIGLGLISVPVLAASAAYAICETFNCNNGLSLKLKEARVFYGIIILSTLIGLMLNFVGINPIKALIYSAVINGVIAVPLIFIIGLIAKNSKIMGSYTSGKLSNTFIMLTFLSMAAATLGMVFTL